LRLLLITIFAALFIILGYRLFFRGGLIRPLGNLLAGVSRVNAGDLRVHIRPGVEDEIGFLTKSFNRMVWSIRTARSKLENTLNHLEDMVRERTSELQVAREKLEEADRAKTAFFQNISHELRTPLTLILAPLEASLNAGREPDAQTRRMMYANGRRLLHLVNELLDLQKIAAGKMTLNPQPLELRNFLIMTSSAFEPYAKSRDLQLTLEIPERLHLVFADVEAVDKCMYNYLSNAIKFTPAGGLIAIRASESAGMIRVEVADNGTGIAEEKLPMLFQRFGHSEESLRKEQEGTGLGL